MEDLYSGKSSSKRWSGRRTQRLSTHEESLKHSRPSLQQQQQQQQQQQRSSIGAEHPADETEKDRMTNPLIADYEENGTMALNQLQQIVEGISFHRPDTYSLRYMAQLLGLPNVNANENGMISMDQLQRTLSLHKKDPHAMEDPIFQVPNVIQLDTPTLFWTTTPEQEWNLLQQEQQQSQCLDPLYVQLWSHVPKLVPITTVQHARLRDDAPSTALVLARVLRTAAEDDAELFPCTFLPLEEAQTLPAVSAILSALPTSNGVVSGWVALHKTNSSVVAVVWYRYDWCTAAATTMDTAAEMILNLLGCSLLDDADLSETAQLWIRLMLVSLVMEQARSCHVCFAIASAEERPFYEFYFNMVVTRHDSRRMIGDLHHSSVRYTFLQYRELLAAPEALSCWKKPADPTNAVGGRHRWLARFPGRADLLLNVETPAPPLPSPITKESLPLVLPSRTAGLPTEPLKPKSGWTSRSKSSMSLPSARTFTNPSPSIRMVTVAVSAVLTEDAMTLHRPTNGTVPIPILPFRDEPPSLDLLRSFPVPSTLPKETAVGPILSSMTAKQKELADLEKSMAPTLCRLFSRVMEERLEYESVEATSKREWEQRILSESRHVLERRREEDLAWQRQLEQDMDAVCEICGDGEVIPENQILFCEACNVALHQMCYGIERVPEGDYYCIPCRRLGRGKRHGGVQQRVPTPLPICCELCPLRQGAFIRTDVKSTNDDPPRDRWVHVLCAKWQGLDHVEKNQELVEDVTAIRMDFRRHRIKCELCLGERGGMNKCMHPSSSCDKWFHVTCARAVGTLRVVHGENCHGAIENNPWKLFCPEHSSIAAEDVSEKAMSVEALIRAAKEFPPEPMPPPAPKPFLTLTGPERKILLADLQYEQALLKELLFRKVGARCEVCDVLDDDYKSWVRCGGCNVMFCRYCQVDSDETKGIYKCPSCLYVDKCKKANHEYETPRCCTCIQNGGLLRESYAKPSGNKFMKNNPAAYQRSLFVKQSWVHELCAIWLPELELPGDAGTVNLSSVVCVSNKVGMINPKWVCILCGQTSGLKMKCDRENCSCMIDGKREKLTMHVTCARQAGFEVRADDKRVTKKGNPLCYVRCYRHGDNESNLRAKLEDLIEIEKRRAGKDYSKADAQMNMADAGRLLYASIQVMRILGWSWRWAEWWVDYNSSWEPLLEPWQKEENMTKEELKIVESTRESRCEDARKCRLVAFGAALRNRSYDVKDGFNNRALERALRAVLHTESLVGPLSPFEIDFYVDWLGRAYRSKSRLLYFGDDKSVVSNDHEFCILPDKSLKHELGDRLLPGEQDLADGEIFESIIKDVDNFLQTALLSDFPNMAGSIKPSQSLSQRKGKADSIDEVEIGAQTTDSYIQSSPRLSTRKRKSNAMYETNIVTKKIGLSPFPKREVKRKSSPKPSELQDARVKPSPSGRRRGRRPNSAKKSMVSDSLGNLAEEMEQHADDAMLLSYTMPSATASFVLPLNMGQTTEQNHRIIPPLASNTANSHEDSVYPESERPPSATARAVQVDRDCSTGEPNTADHAETIPINNEAQVANILPSPSVMGGSTTSENDICRDHVSSSVGMEVANESEQTGSIHSAAVDHVSTTVAVDSTNEFDQKNSIHDATVDHVTSIVGMDTTNESDPMESIQGAANDHSSVSGVPSNTIKGADEVVCSNTSAMEVDPPAMAPEAMLEPSKIAGPHESATMASPSRSKVRFRSKLRRPTETAQYEAVKQRQRQPTRPLTYEHPELRVYEPPCDDDLPLVELALKYPRSQRFPSKHHDARKSEIAPPPASTEDMVPQPNVSRGGEDLEPSRRARRRGKGVAAKSL